MARKLRALAHLTPYTEHLSHRLTDVDHDAHLQRPVPVA